MQGQGQLQVAEGMLKTASQVLTVDLFPPLRRDPGDNFVIADNGCASAFGNFQRVADVIAMAVADKNKVGFGFVGTD